MRALVGLAATAAEIFLLGFIALAGIKVGEEVLGKVNVRHRVEICVATGEAKVQGCEELGVILKWIDESSDGS